MRPRPLLAALLVAVLAAPSFARAQPAAPAESTVTRPMPLVDSTSVVPGGPVPVLDSTVVIPAMARNAPGKAPPESLPRPDTLGLTLRADRLRKRGDVSLTQLLQGRRPVWIETAPGMAPLFGAPRPRTRVATL